MTRWKLVTFAEAGDRCLPKTLVRKETRQGDTLSATVRDVFQLTYSDGSMSEELFGKWTIPNTSSVATVDLNTAQCYIDNSQTSPLIDGVDNTVLIIGGGVAAVLLFVFFCAIKL